VHDDFGIGVPRQVMFTVLHQSISELCVVRELTVEAKTEPLVFVDVLSFEGLRVTLVILSARGISNVPDRGAARVSLHDRLTFTAMRQSKDFCNGPDIFHRIQDEGSIGIEGGHPGSELASILDILQHAREQVRDRLAARIGAQTAFLATRQVINGRNTAFMVQFAHEIGSSLD
jgi:hypothetical protein